MWKKSPENASIKKSPENTSIEQTSEDVTKKQKISETEESNNRLFYKFSNAGNQEHNIKDLSTICELECVTKRVTEKGSHSKYRELEQAELQCAGHI